MCIGKCICLWKSIYVYGKVYMYIGKYISMYQLHAYRKTGRDGNAIILESFSEIFSSSASKGFELHTEKSYRNRVNPHRICIVIFFF